MIDKKPKKNAWVKAMDFLARRDHSEQELIEKLSRHYSQEEITETLEEMRTRGWLLPPEELARKAADSLHKRGKGYLYILHFLRKRGLPRVDKCPETEFEKAMDLINGKLQDPTNIRKLSSLLKNRGFDTETISKVVYEVRRNTQDIH